MEIEVKNPNNLPVIDYRSVKEFQGNLKDLTERNYHRLLNSFKEHGFFVPMYLWKKDGEFYAIDTHQRLRVLKNENITPHELPYVLIEAKDEQDAKKKLLVITSQYGTITQEGLDEFAWNLADDWRTENINFDALPDFDLNGGEGSAEEANAKLQERFIIPPFSIFDTKQGYWQDRKRKWLALGIESEIGRDEGLLHKGDNIEWGGYHADMKGTEETTTVWQGATTSIFDPVICEVIYRWFNIPGGRILDPFAGGSVRGIVAAQLGFEYTGIDLASKQVTANFEQADRICTNGLKPVWINGNSLHVEELYEGCADLVFSCPPYFDLEVYSENPEDLSTMGYPQFLETYRKIIYNALTVLKPDRFACFVVGDMRDKKGVYRNFVSETIGAFMAGGAPLYNEIVLVNVAGSLPVRVGRQMNIGRKVGKMHQNILVFYKGDPQKIKENYPEIDFSGLTQFETNEEEQK